MKFKGTMIVTTQALSLEGLGAKSVVFAPPGPPLAVGLATVLTLPELEGQDYSAAFEAVRQHLAPADMIHRTPVIFCDREMARELAMKIDRTCWEQATSLGRHGGFMTFVDGEHSHFVAGFSPTMARKCAALNALES